MSIEPPRQPSFYFVVDLEATCDDQGSVPRDQSEIIEIGAVLVAAESLAPAGDFQTFVRPVQHPKLTPFCTRLTSITQRNVDGAPTFQQAARVLAEFIAGRDILFCSWGDYDKNQIARDEQRHDTRLALGSDHWNLKQAFADRAGDVKKLGTHQALRRVGLSFEGTPHRGIDDARNIARLLPYVLGRKPIPR